MSCEDSYVSVGHAIHQLILLINGSTQLRKTFNKTVEHKISEQYSPAYELLLCYINFFEQNFYSLIINYVLLHLRYFMVFLLWEHLVNYLLMRDGKLVRSLSCV